MGAKAGFEISAFLGALKQRREASEPASATPVQLIRALADGEIEVGALRRQLRVDLLAFAKALAVLRSEGLVDLEAKGDDEFARLTPDGQRMLRLAKQSEAE
ncbi:MAG: hypothetical protein FJ091_11270 [Deltaproteobacteria bacterium]|nr:hypothetical protein [Deltaproteobacteria bacterium]